jgi:hypothetical protein
VVVFANACATARMAEGSAGAGLARAFLERGTQAYIGTWWEVASPAARVFASGFYAAIGEGCPVGAAMARGREAVVRAFGPDDLSWAGYVLYGDPRTRVLLGETTPERKRPRALLLWLGLGIALLLLVPATLDRLDSPPADEATENPAPALGYLTFESDPPGARLYVDGRAEGYAPLTLELAAGSHEVAFELAGYRRWEASAVVDAGRPQKVVARLEVGP